MVFCVFTNASEELPDFVSRTIDKFDRTSLYQLKHDVEKISLKSYEGDEFECVVIVGIVHRAEATSVDPTMFMSIKLPKRIANLDQIESIQLKKGENGEIKTIKTIELRHMADQTLKARNETEAVFNFSEIDGRRTVTVVFRAPRADRLIRDIGDAPQDVPIVFRIHFIGGTLTFDLNNEEKRRSLKKFREWAKVYFPSQGVRYIEAEE